MSLAGVVFSHIGTGDSLAYTTNTRRGLTVFALSFYKKTCDIHAARIGTKKLATH
jgi:hypothetical protein